MVVHVGFIAPALGVPPIIASTAWSNTESGVLTTVTLGAPSGIEVGMPMVAVVSAGAYAQFAPNTYGFTADPAWTAVYTDPTSGLNHWIIPNIYTKTADASDAAGTASYSWSIDAGDSLGGIAVAILGWPARYGATFSSPSADYTPTPTLASPGGRWQLVLVTQRSSSASAESSPNPTVTSSATLLVDVFSGIVPSTHRAGQIRVYGSERVSPITGAYPSPPNDNWQAMVAVAVSR